MNIMVFHIALVTALINTPDASYSIEKTNDNYVITIYKGAKAIFVENAMQNILTSAKTAGMKVEDDGEFTFIRVDENGHTFTLEINRYYND